MTTPILPYPVIIPIEPGSPGGLVYGPGYIGSDPTIYPTWAALYAAHALEQGPRKIIFDSRYGGAFVIPPGVWDMTQTDIVANNSQVDPDTPTTNGRVLVVVSNGAYLPGLMSIGGPLLIDYQGTSDACVTKDKDVSDYAFALEIGKLTALRCTGSQPFLKVRSTVPGTVFILQLDTGSYISRVDPPFFGSTEVIDIDANINLITVVTGSNIVIANDVLSGSGVWLVVSSFGDTSKNYGALFYPTTQTGYSGVIQYVDQASNTPKVYTRTVNPSVNDDNSNAPYKVGDIWINTTANNTFVCIDPSVGAAIWNPVSKTNNRSVMFRPGYTGSDPSIFSDWGEMYAKLQTIEGRRTIEFMSDLGSLVIPAGNWDMTLTDWYMASISFNNTVTFRSPLFITDGAYLPGLLGIDGPMIINYNGTTGSCINIDLDTQLYGRGFTIKNGVSLSCSFGQYFLSINASSPAFFTFILGSNSQLIRDTVEVINVGSNVTMSIITDGHAGVVQNDTIAGGGDLTFQIQSPSFLKDYSVAFEFPSVQTNLSGTIGYDSFMTQVPVVFSRNVDPTISDDSGSFYKKGDSWINTVSNDTFTCTDASSGAAVWQQTNNVISGVSSQTLIFRPGYLGTQNNIFSSWSDLYTKLQTIDGRKTIEFMADLGTLTLPVGSYNMTLTDWYMADISFIPHTSSIPDGPTLTIPEGVTLTGLLSISGPMKVRYQGTSVACMTVNLNTELYGRGFKVDKGCSLGCTGNKPFISVSSSSTTVYPLLIGSNAAVENTGTPVFNILTNVRITIQAIAPTAYFQDNVLSGNGVHEVKYNSPSLCKSYANPLAPGTPYRSVQSAWTGGSSTTSLMISTPVVYRQSVNPTITDGSTFGYKEGDIWVNGTTDNVFICASFGFPSPVTWVRSVKQYSFAATPTAANDNTQGYYIGDNWIDTTTDNIYICANTTTGAAVWRGPV